MTEKKHDNLLNIRTIGLREWRNPNSQYNRCEPTPYNALEELFQNYSLNKHDKFVDFGAGLGRVSFYTHNRFNCSVKGIEANTKTFNELIGNQERYMFKAKKSDAPIFFKFGLAESYEVRPDENKFYFFNPFSVVIFKQVINNILKSVKKNPRVIDIIIYYPMPEFIEFMNKTSKFEIFNRIKVKEKRDKYDEFVIFRLKEDEINAFET